MQKLNGVNPKARIRQMTELLHLMTKVRDAHPLTDRDVRVIVDKYFSEEVTWSILKDEWDNHMTETQKTAFCATMLADISDK